ncbi:hypothetical protein K1T71_005179 [Dendrolimus kikuchii]|uniref:Uncharacterized protein n=1 Tax=Dendrolimus kikuchii TaxID=765133 RepID=A0ACC1D7T2_9NEOP|nr:hypothetical protein K1T71_005179 [Dendrolimus kikuchii]
MAVALASILRLLLIATIAKCEKTGYKIANGRSPSTLGSVLKPPPPPLISKILPVPFHGGVGRLQRQNKNVGYNYSPPPSPPHPTPTSGQFKFPPPFYKQYNFNFVPQPQTFSSSPSPSLFQKVSGWLFPSVQTNHEKSLVSGNNVAPNKKDCDPCNLVPWIPLIKYNHIGAKNIQSNIPTYGPPSPTALNNFQNIVQYKPQPFQSHDAPKLSHHLSPSVPHTNYGPPSQIQKFKLPSSDIKTVSSTYGPPSPTHILDVTSQRPFSSNVLIASTSYKVPSSSYGSDSSFNSPTSSLNHGHVSTSYNFASTTYLPPSSAYSIPSPSFISSTPSSVYGPAPPQFELGEVDTKEHPIQDDVEVFNQIENLRLQQLPKTSTPTGFKNSYGEPIIHTNIFNIPNIHLSSAEVAESSRIKSKVLPDHPSTFRHFNMSVALANPAPFTINKGRNIHTLQPVALPNLSVSPLPPIFNARPFRAMESTIFTDIFHGNSPQQSDNNNHNVEIQESVPLIEYTQSVDYPPTYIQSPIIDIDALNVTNQSKTYRNIPSSYIIDELRDISPQASEDHISATKTDSDSSFESTGTGIGNDLYDSGIPIYIKPIQSLSHKTNFADLRGLKDEDIDKYRTDSNLQEIDSPLLYLKPSAPHKSHGNFVLAISESLSNHDYEIYDDLPTTTISPLPTLTSGWEESKNNDNHDFPQPVAQENVYQPKIVQIIVPYTRDKENLDNIQTAETVSQDWSIKETLEHQPRKVPPITDEFRVSTNTENYNTLSTSVEPHSPITTISYANIEENNPPSGFSDLYDVKEPPFDIIKLQHTIDDWTQQEYSRQLENPQQIRNNEKYAKQIPDEFFTTTVPTNYVTENYNYNYDFFDHDVSSSIRHSVTDQSINVTNKLQKIYNTINRSKNKNKNDDAKETETNLGPKNHNYTEASSFRTSSTTTTTETTSTSTTTPAPWDETQLSISPLTMEKVYVVTSKPWREPRNATKEWYAVEPLDSKKDIENNDLDDLPFKSPRFINRPSFGFTSESKTESTKTASPYVTKAWYRINEMENQQQFNITMLPESSQHNTTTNLEENTTDMVTAEAHEYSDSDM